MGSLADRITYHYVNLILLLLQCTLEGFYGKQQLNRSWRSEMKGGLNVLLMNIMYLQVSYSQRILPQQ